MRWARWPLFLLSTWTLAACAHRTPTAALDAPRWGQTTFTANAGCAAFPRLSYDRLADTLPTIAGIKGYDDRRDALCGVGK